MKQYVIFFITTIFLTAIFSIVYFEAKQKNEDLLQAQKNLTQIELEKIKAQKEVQLATIKKEETTQVADIQRSETIEKTKIQELNREKEIQLKKEQHKEDTAFKEKIFIFAIFISGIIIALFIYLFHMSRETKLRIERERISSEERMNELNMKKDMVIALVQKIDSEDKESHQKLISIVSGEKSESPQLTNEK